jgi:hypothetical protein
MSSHELFHLVAYRWRFRLRELPIRFSARLTCESQKPSFFRAVLLNVQATLSPVPQSLFTRVNATALSKGPDPLECGLKEPLSNDSASGASIHAESHDGHSGWVEKTKRGGQRHADQRTLAEGVRFA